MKLSSNTVPKHEVSIHKFYKALRGYTVKTLYETIHLRRLCVDFINQILKHMQEICFTINSYKLETGQGRALKFLSHNKRLHTMCLRITAEKQYTFPKEHRAMFQENKFPHKTE